MNVVKTSIKRSRKTPDVLAIPLTGEQKKEAKGKILEHGVAKFEIVGIEVKGIPNLRVKKSASSRTAPALADALADAAAAATTKSITVVCEATIAPESSLPLKNIASEILLIHEDRIRAKFSFR